MSTPQHYIPSMKYRKEPLSEGKKLYFASDFHLGIPTKEKSLEREKKIIRWLNKIQQDAGAIYLVGDIFDFWFEYKHAIPKGFVRVLGKLAELTDNGIPVIFFTGNHDMWMFDYFTQELNITIYRKPIQLIVGDKKLYVGHGDGLGPGDFNYKILKRIFNNPLCQWLFARIHPNLGIGIANYWSRSSRLTHAHKEEVFLGEKEHLWAYCKRKEQEEHHDLYIFGHRHLPLSLEVGETSRYYNLGEWVNHYTYGEFDGESFKLLEFEGDEKVY